MAQSLKVWYDAEGDDLEVLFSDEPGFMRATSEDAVMERVNQRGHLLGFSIMNVSRLRRDRPLTALLNADMPGRAA